MTCCDQYNEDDAHFECQKHQIKMCKACAKCRDPELYCKFRPSCLIHFLDKEKAKEAKRAAL